MRQAMAEKLGKCIWCTDDAFDDKGYASGEVVFCSDDCEEEMKQLAPRDEILTAATPYLAGRIMTVRARIFKNQYTDPMTIALLTDTGDDNPGPSITNGILHAVKAVLERWPDIDPARLVVIEHYDDREKLKTLASKHSRAVSLLGRPDYGESFDLVTFDGGMQAVTRLSLGQDLEPHWKRIRKDEAQTLCCYPLL
jgi:hypothetical protein